MTAIVTLGDARALPYPDASIDLIVTSPPYWSLRSYTDGGEHYAGQIGAEATRQEYIDSLVSCTQEWARVLKPEGSIFVNLGDKYSGYNNGSGKGRDLGGVRGQSRTPVDNKRGPEQYGVPNKSLIGLPWRYALRCIDDLGLILRAEVIWAKPNGLPESVRDRVRRSHEQWFHFVRQPRYFATMDAIRTENGTLPGSVWIVATQPLKVPAELGVSHFAAFPMELPRRIILGWSPVGGVVLDPFGGTGTTALVASALGRVGISLDTSTDYCRLAQWRIADPKQRDRAARAA